jgi:hypothetical protein
MGLNMTLNSTQKAKANVWLIMLLIFGLLLWPTTAVTGTYFLGVKGWYATWDSGILDWLEEDIATTFAENRLVFEADRDPGDGYLIGPLLGYQTDDGKWSYSLAIMVFSDFDQDWGGNAGVMMLSGIAELDRHDIDFAVNYTLSQNFKIYAGIKYQDSDLDFALTYTPPSGMQQTDDFTVDFYAYIPTVGLGAVYPLNDKVVIGGQAGLLYAIMDMKITNPGGDSDNIWPHPGLGFNTEANITCMPWQNLLFQLGYRYQVFTIKARGPGREDRVTSYDITHGPTFSFVLTF